MELLLQLFITIFIACALFLAAKAGWKWFTKSKKHEEERVEPSVSTDYVVVEEARVEPDIIGTFETIKVPVEDIIQPTVETPPVKKPRAKKKPAPSTIEVSTVSKSGAANSEFTSTASVSSVQDNILMNGIILGSYVGAATATPVDDAPASSSFGSSSTYEPSSSHDSSSSFDSGSSSDSGGGGGW